VSAETNHGLNHGNHAPIMRSITTITPDPKSLARQSRTQSRQYTFQSRIAGSFRNPRNPNCEVASWAR
jgi:hypothetical protein